MSILERIRRRLTTAGDDAGVSLPELIVVSLVSMILLGSLGVMFTGSLKATRKANAHVAATADGRLAMDTVARRLRVAVRPADNAPMFTQATPSAMTFYASLSTGGSTAHPAPSVVSYVVDPDKECLLETITPTAGPAPVRTQCLAFGSVVPTFSYYAVTKRPTLLRPAPVAAPTSPLPLPLSATDVLRVGAVQVDLAVRNATAAAGDRPVELSTRVLLVNELNEESA